MRLLILCLFLCFATSCVSAEPMSKLDVETIKERAEQGYAYEQFLLGLMYDVGDKIPQSDVLAAQWYLRAAHQGNVMAQDMIGGFYNEGIGVQQDFREAVKWFRAAAEGGYSGGQIRLADAYVRGMGVPQNYIEAYAWYSVAAVNTEPGAAKMRDRVASKLDLAALSKAQELALVYYKKYPLK